MLLVCRLTVRIELDDIPVRGRTRKVVGRGKLVLEFHIEIGERSPRLVGVPHRGAARWRWRRIIGTVVVTVWYRRGRSYRLRHYRLLRLIGRRRRRRRGRLWNTRRWRRSVIGRLHHTHFRRGGRRGNRRRRYRRPRRQTRPLPVCYLTTLCVYGRSQQRRYVPDCSELDARIGQVGGLGGRRSRRPHTLCPADGFIWYNT